MNEPPAYSSPTTGNVPSSVPAAWLRTNDPESPAALKGLPSVERTMNVFCTRPRRVWFRYVTLIVTPTEKMLPFVVSCVVLPRF